jgi:hypothetical protein
MGAINYRSGVDGLGRVRPGKLASFRRQATKRTPPLPPIVKRSQLNRGLGSGEGSRFSPPTPRPDPTSEVGVISHKGSSRRKPSPWV